MSISTNFILKLCMCVCVCVCVCVGSYRNGETHYSDVTNVFFMTEVASRVKIFCFRPFFLNRIRGNSVSVETRLRAGRSVCISRKGLWWDFFLLLPPLCPDWLSCTPSLHPMGAGSFYPSREMGRGGGVKLTTNLYLVAMLRMRGSIPPLRQYVFRAWWSS